MAMKTTVRKRAAERREEILGAVCRIIGERGLSALTTTTLAAEVGVTSGALFRHFVSRDDILDGAVGYALERIAGTFPDESLSPRERLLKLAHNRVALFRAEPGLAWLLRSEEASLSLPADTVARLREQVDRSARYLLDTIREGVASGDIRDDIEPAHLLVVVMGTIHALAGMPGVHGAARKRNATDPALVLAALEKLITPTGNTNTRRRTPARTRR